jgi:simple sugar transport system permease protein
MLARIGLRLLAPVSAVVFSLIVAGVILWISGNDPIEAYRSMLEFGLRRESIISTINRAVPLYLSGVAFAIAFKMGLFNIGVEGQYTVAVLFAAWAGAAVNFPAPLHVAFIILVAMAAGGLWGAIPGVLKATRGVHEVISTIMLNFIATSVVAYLLANYFLDRADETLNLQTEKIPGSGRMPTLNPILETVGLEPKSGTDLESFVLLAAVVGAVYYVLIWRTRFGYDLRASGINPIAAQASGVASKEMIVKGMTLSGMVAGLVGLPVLLGFSFNYNLDFPTGLGFTGITVALLGRNNPVGIAVGALLIGFLDRSSQILDLEGIPKEITVIMEGVIVLSVVIAYEVVERITERREQQQTAEELDDGEGPGPAPAPAPVGVGP